MVPWQHHANAVLHAYAVQYTAVNLWSDDGPVNYLADCSLTPVKDLYSWWRLVAMG